MTNKLNIYINPNAPTWFKRMMLEEILRDIDVNVLSAEEMRARFDRLIGRDISDDSDDIPEDR